MKISKEKQVKLEGLLGFPWISQINYTILLLIQLVIFCYTLSSNFLQVIFFPNGKFPKGISITGFLGYQSNKNDYSTAIAQYKQVWKRISKGKTSYDVHLTKRQLKPNIFHSRNFQSMHCSMKRYWTADGDLFFCVSSRLSNKSKMWPCYQFDLT